MRKFTICLRILEINLNPYYDSKTSGSKLIQRILAKIQPASYLDVLMSLLEV